MTVPSTGLRTAMLASILATGIGIGPPAHAERPMNVDDAGTLEFHGAKMEAGWSKDDHLRGVEGAVGYSPIENLELELNFGRAKDNDAEPDQTFKGVGVAMKWVPLQQELGLSAGLKLEWGREKASDDAGLDETGEASAVLALLGWRLSSGQTLHLNLSREWVRAGGETEAENGWGVGTAYPLSDSLFVVAEVFGSQHGAPDRAVGLRYVIVEGLKVSGEVGRGNDRSFANVGIAWEF